MSAVAVCQLRGTCPAPGTTCGGLSGTHFLTCDDILSIVIQSILDLAIPQGATVDEILAYIPTICPQTISLETLTAAINIGARQGTLFRRIASVGATPTYLINAYMANLNCKNRIYTRDPCQSNNFFRCSN